MKLNQTNYPCWMLWDATACKFGVFTLGGVPTVVTCWDRRTAAQLANSVHYQESASGWQPRKMEWEEWRYYLTRLWSHHVENCMIVSNATNTMANCGMIPLKDLCQCLADE